MIPFGLNDTPQHSPITEPNSSYDMNNLAILNIDENAEVDHQHKDSFPSREHRFSLFSTASEFSTADESPFFARRGSLSTTGPASLRWMQSQSQYSEHYRDRTPSIQFHSQMTPEPGPSPLGNVDSNMSNVSNTSSLYQPIPDDPSNPPFTVPSKQPYFQFSPDRSSNLALSMQRHSRAGSNRSIHSLSPNSWSASGLRYGAHSLVRSSSARKRGKSFSPSPRLPPHFGTSASEYQPQHLSPPMGPVMRSKEESPPLMAPPSPFPKDKMKLKPRGSNLMNTAPTMTVVQSMEEHDLSPDERYERLKIKRRDTESRRSVEIIPEDEPEFQHLVDEMASSTQSRSEYTSLSEVRKQHFDVKYEMKNDWKTSWKGIALIAMIWCSSWHCLYSFSAIQMSAMRSFNIIIFDVGLMYFFTFLGVSGGIILSSIILNQQSMIEASQMIVTYSMFIVFLSQSICAIISYYVYYYGNEDNTNVTTFCWYILVASRFLLGLALGCVETAIDNLLFEWFCIVDEPYFINKARPYALLFREFGHCSARLMLVPLIYLTFSDYENLFYSLLFGVILSGLSWLSMIFAAIKDSKSKFDRMIAYTKDTKGIKGMGSSMGMTSMSDNDNDTQSMMSGLSSDPTKPLLNKPQTYTINKNEYMMKSMAHDVLSYKRWHELEYFGWNKSVFLSILYLSLNFAISFSFIVLSMVSFAEQYGFTDYTANLVLCLVPVLNLTCSGWIRSYILAPLESEWFVAFIGCAAFSTIFSLFSWLKIDGEPSLWLPIVCVLIFIFGYECFTAAGYEFLLSSTTPEIQGLVSAINSSSNYLFSSIFVIVFSILVMQNEDDMMLKYQWSYSFLAFASYLNIVVIILLKLYHRTFV